MRVKIWGILLLCITVLSGTVACSGGGVAPNGMTGAEIMAMSQNASVNTFQFTAIVEMDMMGETIDMYMTGAADEINREMYMTETSPQAPGYIMQVYMVDGWLYMTDPEDTTEWIKTELADEIWEERNVADQQMALVEGFLDAKYIGMENVGGFNCYKIDIDPNWDAIFNAADISETEGVSNEEMIDMIKETSCITWIAENDYFPIQIFFSMTMDMQFLGDMTMDMTMTFSNINQPVTVTLPVTAQNATEISYEDFMAGDY